MQTIADWISQTLEARANKDWTPEIRMNIAALPDLQEIAGHAIVRRYDVPYTECHIVNAESFTDPATDEISPAGSLMASHKFSLPRPQDPESDAKAPVSSRNKISK